MIDQHVLRTTQLETNNPDFDYILQVIALKLSSEPPAEMLPYTTKTIIFNKLEPKRLCVTEQTA